MGQCGVPRRSRGAPSAALRARRPSWNPAVAVRTELWAATGVPPHRASRIVIAVSRIPLHRPRSSVRLRLTPRRPRARRVGLKTSTPSAWPRSEEGGGFSRRITQWVEFAHLAAHRSRRRHSRPVQGIRHAATGSLGRQVVVVRNWTHLPSWEPIRTEPAKNRLGWPDGVTLAVHAGNMGAKQGSETSSTPPASPTSACAGAFVLSRRRGRTSGARRMSRWRLQTEIRRPTRRRRLSPGARRRRCADRQRETGRRVYGGAEQAHVLLCRGRPVVAATDPAGIAASEVTAAQAGVVVPAGDPEALLEAILELRNNDRHRSRASGSTAGPTASLFSTRMRLYRGGRV